MYMHRHLLDGILLLVVFNNSLKTISEKITILIYNNPGFHRILPWGQGRKNIIHITVVLVGGKIF